MLCCAAAELCFVVECVSRVSRRAAPPDSPAPKHTAVQHGTCCLCATPRFPAAARGAVVQGTLHSHQAALSICCAVLCCLLLAAYTFLISAWVYPVIVHWVWSPNGWLSAFNTKAPLFGSGMIDFAGSAVVHMTGGLAGLVGCIMVGPRLGRFDSNGQPVDMPGHSATLVVLGTCLLWFGWYGFNPGSVINIVDLTGASSSNFYLTSGRAAVTTTLGGAAGVLTALVTTFVRHKAWDLISVCNGALVGFVAITGSAAVVEPWAALIAGMVGSWIFDATCLLWLKLRIDDPLSASPMHGIVGIWGVLFAGFFATEEYVGQAYLNGKFGAFMGGGGHLLACQVVGILVIAAWVMFHAGVLFFVLKMFRMLRISPEEEQAGLDVSKHGGSAYNYDHGLNKPDKMHV